MLYEISPCIKDEVCENEINLNYIGELYLIQPCVIEFVSDLRTGQWFSRSIPAFSTNKTNNHDITEILLNVALYTITSP
jgi:hypothetical protein